MTKFKSRQFFIFLSVLISILIFTSCAPKQQPTQQSTQPPPTQTTKPIICKDPNATYINGKCVVNTAPADEKQVETICYLHDDGSLDCSDRNELGDITLNIEGFPFNAALLGDEILSQLENAKPEDDTLLICGSGGGIDSLISSSNMSAEQLEKNVEQPKNICGQAIEGLLNLSFEDVGGDTGYDRARRQAVQNMDASVEECYDTGGGIAPMASTRTQRKPLQECKTFLCIIGGIYDRIIDYVQQRWGNNGSRHFVTEKNGVYVEIDTQKDEQVVTTTNETTGASETTIVETTVVDETYSEVVHDGTLVSAGNLISHKKTTTVTRTTTHPDGTTDTETNTKEVLDNDDGSQTVTVTITKNGKVVSHHKTTIPAKQSTQGAQAQPDCFEINCAATCDERKASWERFKMECDNNNWQTYECKSWVAAQTGCPDPGVIMPSPTGDYSCGVFVTKPDIQTIRLALCENRQGIVNPGPDGETTCTVGGPINYSGPLPDICSDPRSTTLEDQCVMEFPIIGPNPKPDN